MEATPEKLSRSRQWQIDVSNARHGLLKHLWAITHLQGSMESPQVPLSEALQPGQKHLMILDTSLGPGCLLAPSAMGRWQRTLPGHRSGHGFFGTYRWLHLA